LLSRKLKNIASSANVFATHTARKERIISKISEPSGCFAFPNVGSGGPNGTGIPTLIFLCDSSQTYSFYMDKGLSWNANLERLNQRNYKLTNKIQQEMYTCYTQQSGISVSIQKLENRVRKTANFTYYNIFLSSSIRRIVRKKYPKYSL
jgi:hypothetical protein